MTGRHLVTTLALLAAVAGVHPGSGRSQSADIQTPAPPLFSTRSELVVLHVVVRDRRGEYVSGLGSDAFTVLENDERQTIDFFSGEDAPVTIGLVIDDSGSMRHERDLVIAAAGGFVETSNPEDEIFALVFSDGVRSALPPSAPFTGNANILRSALIRILTAQGRTALYDGLAAGLEYLALGQHQRKALVVVSDGGDNASRTTFEDIVRKTQVSNTVIHTVALVDPVERDSNPRRLGRLAAASGGQSFRPESLTRVADVLKDIARDIRHTYTIGYVPTNQARQGRFHRTRVSVRVPDRRRLVVRTREGYFVEE